MPSEAPSRTRAIDRLWNAIEASLPFASAGAVWGAAVALREILAQGYLALGYRRTALMVLRDDALGAALAAALVVGLLRVLRRSILPSRLRRAVSLDAVAGFIEDRRHRWTRAAATVAVGALGYAIPSSVREDFQLVPLALGFAAAILFWAALSATRRALRRVPSAHSREGLVGGALCGLAVVIGSFWSAWEFSVSGLNVGRELAGFALLLSASPVVFFIVRAGLEAGSRPEPPPLGALYLLPAWGTFLLGVASPVLAQPSITARNPQNLVLIGIDTLRMDHTSLVPGAEDSQRRPRLTPNLEELAASGTTFLNATAQAPWTMPSFASVLTGRYPPEHGAISISGRLRPRELTLAEVLREAGYRTSAVVSNLFVDSIHGFAQGFGRFDESAVGDNLAITSGRVTDAALRELDQLGSGPFFLFLHYTDPHYSYRDHPGWDFADGYSGWIREDESRIDSLRARAAELTPSDVAYLRSLYDEEVAYTDREIGRLLEALSARGLAENTVVAVVADHGEEFLERGWLGHTISLHEEVIRVPLVLRLPGRTRARRTITRPVETRALFSTLLGHLRVDGFERGPDLLSEPTSSRSARGEPAYSSVWLADAPESSGKRVRISAVRDGSWKLIRDHGRGEERLYDLEADPAERHDLSRRATERRRELARSLDEWLERMPAAGSRAPSRDLSEDEVQRLKALGYL